MHEAGYLVLIKNDQKYKKFPDETWQNFFLHNARSVRNKTKKIKCRSIVKQNSYWSMRGIFEYL